ncbi:sensor histidine kinase [Roseivirga sp.]|uniref:sensor histidine kinase n=1 Tax=Roseivirga sp. TaxID=1964215 RepID=UPI002B26AC30|nr:histidine kinase [Roseivirga sp.]
MKLMINQQHSRWPYALFALLVWLFFALALSFGSSGWLIIVVFSSFFSLLSVVAIWALIKFALTSLIAKRSTLGFIKGAILISLASALLILLFNIVIVGYFPGMKAEGMPSLIKSFYSTFFLYLLVLSIAAFIYVWKEHRRIQDENHDFREKLLQGEINLKSQELNFLKSQIQPHFLFNTLNTIYGMALTKSEKTPDTILKLSGLLDYILYSVNKEKVALKNELEHIKQYVSLEKIRFEDSLEVSIEFDEITDAISLPPMLFLPFVENAFKHGVRNENKLTVKLKLEITDKAIFFVVENSATEPNENTAGIGLQNIKSRLNLIFENRHSLKTDYKDGVYKVELRIDQV